MTNNNLIEEFEELFLEKVKFYNLSLDNENYYELMEFAKFFLTQKDQEHKAELESIKGEIPKEMITGSTYDYLNGYNHARGEALSILNNYINKLTNN